MLIHLLTKHCFDRTQTPSAPTMVQGAYAPDKIYSMSDLTELKEYAKERGVEIIMEIDIPGHAAAWNDGKPEIMADCFDKYYYNINDFALNPTLDETYSTVEAILSDVINATTATYMHIGGDEVIYGCWKEDSTITTFMSANSITSYDDLLSYFVSRADAIVNNLDAKVIHWEEVFSAGCKVSEGTVFQVWTDSSKVASITAASYPVIASPSDYWYLNIASNTWQRIYEYEPTATITSTKQQAFIVGGEVALWGEYVDDVNIISSIYPRAAAAAERLWSAKSVTDQDDFLRRLDSHRCRLVSRGVGSSPVHPGYCEVHYV